MWKNFEDIALIPKKFNIAGSEYQVKLDCSS